MIVPQAQTVRHLTGACAKRLRQLTYAVPLNARSVFTHALVKWRSVR